MKITRRSPWVPLFLGILTGAITLFVLAASAKCEEAGSQKKPEISLAAPFAFYGLSVGFDALTTEIRLHRPPVFIQRDGYMEIRTAVELNGLMDRGWKRATFQAIEFAGLVALDVWLQKRGYRKAAWILRVVAAGVNVGLGWRNLEVR